MLPHLANDVGVVGIAAHTSKAGQHARLQHGQPAVSCLQPAKTLHKIGMKLKAKTAAPAAKGGRPS